MPFSHPRLAGYVFVVFADDWGRHPSSCQHLFRRIIPHAQVIWVNTIGLRTPRVNLHDVQRTMQVIGAWVRPDANSRRRFGASAVDPAVNAASTMPSNDGVCPHILSPVMWPSFQGPRSSALNHRLLSRAVHKALRHLAPGKQPILVSTSPTVPGLFRDHAFRRTVYYCVDDFTHWHGIDGRTVHRLEQETLDACDLMIAASATILETRSSLANVSTLLSHGVDLTHFSRAKRDPSSPLAALPRPLVGMFGIFDRRVDGQALRAAALLSPQATFVILGPVVDRDPGEFRDLPNVRFMGPVPYADLPGHVCHFDLCMLPYVVDESTRHISPLKLKEYLATGKPVIASPIPEAIRLADHLVLADAQAFPGAVASALSAIASASSAKPIRLRPRLEDFLRSESWEAKAACFLSKVMEGL
ncbi:glycosyltransferase [Massilia oculi]|uniref:glycosyltransferase n=1 Tax=Massilia oculi TaxID=945844 RepID=UPI0028A94DD6|nr:glycosyltransferase [Massilia oculi]